MYKIQDRTGYTVEISEAAFIAHITSNPDAARGIFSNLMRQGTRDTSPYSLDELLTEDVVCALVKADPCVIHSVPLYLHTKKSRRTAVRERPDILLSIKSPDRDLIEYGIECLCTEMESNPSLNTRGIVANFITFLNANCRDAKLYAKLMMINTYPWRAIPKDHINLNAASCILNDFPESLSTLKDLNLGVTLSEMILKGIMVSSEWTRHKLLEHATLNEVMTRDVVHWVLENIERDHYPVNFIKLLERDYRREYGIKKLKEPN